MSIDSLATYNVWTFVEDHVHMHVTTPNFVCAYAVILSLENERSSMCLLHVPTEEIAVLVAPGGVRKYQKKIKLKSILSSVRVANRSARALLDESQISFPTEDYESHVDVLRLSLFAVRSVRTTENRCDRYILNVTHEGSEGEEENWPLMHSKP